MDESHAYFLKISGSIHSEKQKEFQQTVQFVFNHLSSECLERTLAVDVNTRNLYHFYSLWPSEASLRSFQASLEFDLLKGAFQTLGSWKGTLSGRKPVMWIFEQIPQEN